ncbi:hypothetical protein [Spirosoma pomorum]
MKKICILLALILIGCQPKPITPITSQISKVWKANTVKEGDVLVFTLGASNNIKPGYAGYRLDLSQIDKATLKDIDGRLLTGTWRVSTDNKRLILDNLVPKPTKTSGLIEFTILNTPDGSSLNLQRLDQSRKTGNTLNQYGLIPE